MKGRSGWHFSDPTCVAWLCQDGEKLYGLSYEMLHSKLIAPHDIELLDEARRAYEERKRGERRR